MARSHRRQSIVWALVGCAVIASTSLPASAGPLATRLGAGPDAGLDRILAAAFRIDLIDERVELDFRPATNRVEGSANLRFRMRPRQSRALFHFNPLREWGTSAEKKLIRSVWLDGSRVSLPSVRIIRPAPGAEPAFEIDRPLDAHRTHELRVMWHAPGTPGDSGRLYPMFDDTEGPSRETETMWPTVSSPEELTRHRLVVRVHSDRPYEVIGSGRVLRKKGTVQTWTIDTGRPVSTSNVYFAAVPAEHVRRLRFTIGGVEVTMLSDRPAPTTRRAKHIAAEAIPALIRELGPFPTPRMQILLTGWDSGMEYYGATRTGWDSLRHELGHMYFATTAVNRTWRDTWLDEAITTWWDERNDIAPIAWGFRGRLAVGRPPAAPGFDEDAYGTGARVMARIARELGGDRQMLAFLADVYARRAYRPFTTDDFIGDVIAAQKRITRADLERWLYGRQ